MLLEQAPAEEHRGRPCRSKRVSGEISGTMGADTKSRRMGPGGAITTL